MKGIIWHQGESDSNDDFAPHYGDALVDLVERFRNEFGDSELPFVACPLSDFFAEIMPAALKVNAAIEALPRRVPHTAVVSADGLTPKDDNVHLDSASARELGRRYAEAMLKLQRE